MNTIKMLKTETTLVNGKELLTNHWLMDCAKELTGMQRHRMYYGQFCTPDVMRYVQGQFTDAQWLKMSKSLTKDNNEHLNGLFPMERWDRIDVRQMVGRMVTETTYEDAPKGTMYWSPSQNTCIVKEAARQLIESGKVGAL